MHGFLLFISRENDPRKSLSKQHKVIYGVMKQAFCDGKLQPTISPFRFYISKLGKIGSVNSITHCFEIDNDLKCN